MTTAAERRGLDLSSAPEDAQAVLNRLMFLEDENTRYREALKAAHDVLTYSGAMSELTDSPGNMAFAIINHALYGGASAPAPLAADKALIDRKDDAESPRTAERPQS